MLKLLKYLKKSIVPILVIVLFLIGQAICDLSLPDYTSKVVNVGIQQGGVENPVPDVIRATEMDKLMLFMNESDKDIVLSNYNYLDKASLSDKDLRVDEPIYELNTKDKIIIEELSSIFGKPMLVVEGFENDSEQTKKIHCRRTNRSCFHVFQYVGDCRRKLFQDFPSACQRIQKTWNSLCAGHAE